MAKDVANIDIELFNETQETCYFAAKTLQKTKFFYQNVAEDILKLPLTQFFKVSSLATAILPIYLHDSIKFLKAQGMTANVVARDGAKEVQFIFDNKIVANFDPAEEPVISARELEQDFTALFNRLNKSAKPKTSKTR